MKIKFTGPRPCAFTIVELLIVITVIATIAALAMPVFNGVIKHGILQRATAERDQLETAIESYHHHYGFYPPGNGWASAGNLSPALTNQLYYELIGATSDSQGANFTNLDNSTNIDSGTMASVYNVKGIMNCTKGSGEDALQAQTFIPALKPGQMAAMLSPASQSPTVTFITSSAGGDAIYQPLPGVKALDGRNANPWRYLYPGVNNPNSYDLWLQISVGGKTNLICNWKDQPTINSPLP